MVLTYVFKMISGVGFHQDKSGNLLIRYHRNDLLKLRTAFDQALSEIDKMLAQPAPVIPAIPIVQNPLLALPPQNVVPLPPQAVETMRLINEKTTQTPPPPPQVSAGTKVTDNGNGFRTIEGFGDD